MLLIKNWWFDAHDPPLTVSTTVKTGHSKTMGLFDQVLAAVNNPDQQASPDQLGNIVNVMQQLASSKGADASTTPAVMSVVGQFVRSSLQEKRQTIGVQQTEALVDRYSGMAANPSAVSALFSPAQQEQLANAVAQKTGLDANLILSMLPLAIPVILNFLKSGASKSGSPATQASGSNSVLSAFLDSDGDRDVDLGDALSLASRFLNR